MALRTNSLIHPLRTTSKRVRSRPPHDKCGEGDFLLLSANFCCYRQTFVRVAAIRTPLRRSFSIHFLCLLAMSSYLSERNRFSRAATTVAAMNVLAKRTGGPAPSPPRSDGVNSPPVNSPPPTHFGNPANNAAAAAAPPAAAVPVTKPTASSPPTAAQYGSARPEPLQLQPAFSSNSFGEQLMSPTSFASSPKSRHELSVSQSARAAAASIGLASPPAAAARSPDVRSSHAPPPSVIPRVHSAPLLRSATLADFSELRHSGPRNVAFFHTLSRNVMAGYFETLQQAKDALSPRSQHGSPKAAHAKSRAFLGGTECAEVCSDILASLRHLAQLQYFHPAIFVRNERFQSLKDAPCSEISRGTVFWDEWRSAWESFVSDFVKDAVNHRVIAEADRSRYVHMGNGSVLDMMTGVLVHEWQSADAAKAFLDIWQRTWAAVFEFRIDGVTCPVSAGFNVQGDYVTVTCLPPVDATRAPLTVDVGSAWTDSFPTNGSAITVAARRLCHALGCETAPPFYYGVDGRYYILTTDFQYSGQLSFGTSRVQRPRNELLRAMRTWPYRQEPAVPIKTTPTAKAENLERYAAADDTSRQLLEDPFAEQDLDSGDRAHLDPLVFVRKVALRRVCIDLLVQGAKMEMNGQGTVRKEFIVRHRVLPATCHAHGVNMCFLYELWDTLKQMILPSQYEINDLLVETLRDEYLEAIRVEMASRTVKDLAKLDMAFGAGAGLTVTEGARRVMVPNRIAQLLVDGDAHFWDNVVMPHLRLKFACPPVMHIAKGSVPMPLLLRQMVMALGCELDGDGRRFSHFCPCAGTKAAVFRPSALGQLAYEKRWAEIELEVPRMWVQLSKMPAGHPLKHSMMLRAATDTILTRASDLCGIAIGSIDQEVAHHHEGTVPHCEMMAMQVELELFASKSDRSAAAAVVTQLLRIAPCTGDGDPNAQIVGAKLLALGMHTKDLQLTSTACQVMHRAAHALAPLFSTTMNVAMNVSTGLMKHETSAASAATYFDAATAHATLMGDRSVGHLARFLIGVTSSVVDAEPMAVATRLPGCLAFAQLSYKTLKDVMGPETAPSCMAAYHLAFIALAHKQATGGALPTIDKQLIWMYKALECVRTTPAERQLGLARGPKLVDLLRRVATTLGTTGDKASAALLTDHCLVMERHAGHAPSDRLALSMSWKVGSFKLGGTGGGIGINDITIHDADAPSDVQAQASASFKNGNRYKQLGTVLEDI